MSTQETSPLKREERLGVRGRLLILVSFGILSVAILVSILFVWVSLREHEKTIKTHGGKLAEELAEKVFLAMLYGDRDHVVTLLTEFYDKNNISHVSIHLKDAETCAEKGSSNYEFGLFQPEEINDLAMKRKGHYWHFSRPIILKSDSAGKDIIDIYSQEENKKNEVLGYTHIAIDITPIRQLLWKTFLSTSILTSSITFALLFLVNLGINRLIKPLFALATSMKDASPVTEFNGPKELRYIATTYNQMIQTLAERDKELSDYNRKLEADVAIRTKELVEARDLALASSRAKSQFMANTSHELRTPLQSVLGYTELVKESALSAGHIEMLENLDVIETDARKLLQLINTILDLAKVESGNMELRPEEINIKDILHEVANTVRPIIDYNKNTFILTNHIKDGTTATLDRTKLVQILTNLLSNAAKYTKAGIVALIADTADHHLTVRVTDTGVGIAEDHIGLIFDPFKQIDNNMTRAFGGTGLGLAITKQFCVLMGGDVSVESELGKGTTFTVNIPLSRL